MNEPSKPGHPDYRIPDLDRLITAAMKPGANSVDWQLVAGLGAGLSLRAAGEACSLSHGAARARIRRMRERIDGKRTIRRKRNHEPAGVNWWTHCGLIDELDYFAHGDQAIYQPPWLNPATQNPPCSPGVLRHRMAEWHESRAGGGLWDDGMVVREAWRALKN